MPLWRIFSDPSTFTTDQRGALAQAITDLYVSRGLPAFYVNVVFIDVPATHLYISGKQKKNFVRIVAEQIARVMPDPATEQGKTARKAWMDLINQTLKPHIIDRTEIDWEFHIAETPRDLWRIQGLDAPPANSEGEKLWMEKNYPVPWDV